VQNASARVLTRSARRDHITPVLAELHWLPVQHRITYKIAMVTWKALHDQAPAYLKELIHIRHPRRDLRSSSEVILDIDIPRTVIGKRALKYAGPNIWNELPAEIRCLDSLSAFKRELKTFLFTKAFN
jgi:hypothetical protein